MRLAHQIHRRSSASERRRILGLHVAGVADRGQVPETGLSEHECWDYACYEPDQADEVERGGEGWVRCFVR